MEVSTKVLRTLPEHGHCFVCGKDNPHGMGVRWQLMDDQSISSQTTMGLAQQGPPGYAHGGASAALLDEAMGSSVWVAGYHAVAVNLQVNYSKPVPLNKMVIVRGKVERTEGRKVYTSAIISSQDGTNLVTAHGIFVEAPELTNKVWEYIDKSK